MTNRIKRKTYIPRNEEVLVIELTCYCCGSKFVFGNRKPCGCNGTKRHCVNCLKCEAHCTCKKARFVSEYARAFVMHAGME